MGSVGCDWLCGGWVGVGLTGVVCGEDGLTVGNLPVEGVVAFVAASFGLGKSGEAGGVAFFAAPFGFGNAGEVGGVAFVLFGAATDGDD
jgi:hypothetical protein